MKLTAERLREVLRYCPDTGLFYWIKKTSKKTIIGSKAGCHEKRYGYILIGIDGVIYGAHRLAWLYVHGEWPVDELDHANGCGADNRWQNLRAATHRQNLKNIKRPIHNTSGFKGVHLHRETGKWRARIVADGKHKSLGLHSTLEGAHAAYCAAARALHGEFARFG